MLDKKIIVEGRNVLLILQEGLQKIKLEFLPKNTTSRLQPYDAGITKTFKHKYRKLLIRYILACKDYCARYWVLLRF